MVTVPLAGLGMNKIRIYARYLVNSACVSTESSRLYSCFLLYYTHNNNSYLNLRPPSKSPLHQSAEYSIKIRDCGGDLAGSRRLYTADSAGPIRVWESISGKSTLFDQRDRDKAVTALACILDTDLWAGTATGVRGATSCGLLP